MICIKLECFKLIEYATLAEFFFRVVISLVLVFISFTVNAILKILSNLLFKIFCWQCWKTAAVDQRMITLAERDEDEELTPLEPVVERAHSTLGSCPGGATSGAVH